MHRLMTILAVLLIAGAAACSDDTPEGSGNQNNGANNGQNNGANNGVNNGQNNGDNNGANNGVNNGANNGENNGVNNGANNGDNNGANNGGPECGDGSCDEGEDSESCPEDCPPIDPICEAGETRCVNPRTVETCSEDGSEWTVGPCAVGEICVEEAGACLPVICRPGEVLRCASQTEIVICDETGTGEALDLCEAPLFCDFLNGEYVCTDQICDPGQTRCAGLAGTEMCTEDGTGWEPGEQCDSGTQCDNGACRSLCEINSKVSSFLGCEYYSADFDNIEGGTDAPHAVIISNPNDIEVEITVSDAAGEPVTVDEWPLVVPPNELAIWFFRQGAINTTSNMPLLNTRAIDGTIISDETFRFESSAPVTAHQFNPLPDANTFTNDASLLLPTNAVGHEYLVMSWKHRQSPVIEGFIEVMAFGDEPTTVAVTPTANVKAGMNAVTNEPIPRIATGETVEFTLMPGQILQLETEGPDGADLTGTEIIANQPVIVFGGHACANVPLGVNFCDHIEQQMFPVNSWGSQYIGTHFVDRDPNTPQVEVWRIMASQDDTVITTVPAIPNVDGVTLNRGEFVEFETSDHFELSATAPVLAGQYMTGSSYRGGAGIGDPAFTLASPIEQWRRDYIVLTPPAYTRGHYLNIASRTGNQVILDGEPVPEEAWNPIGNGEFSVARLPVEEGPHNLIAEGDFTVIPYGYDSAVSYAYPGGLNLEDVQ